MRFTLTKTPINPEPLRNDVTGLNAGGYCSFEGWVRDHHLGKGVTTLDYEAYEGLALKQGESILTEALQRFDIIDARAIHRIGSLVPGDLAVWIGVSSVHRAPAFEACQYLIDAIKDSVPIWKHEVYTDGTEEWVDPTDCSCSKHKHPLS